MFTQNPNATPLWLLMVFSAVSYFGYPRIKKLVSRYVAEATAQNLYTFLILLVVMAFVVTLSVMIV